jgi:DNA topoisomerase-3
MVDIETKKLKYDFTRESICDCPKCKNGKLQKGKGFYKCSDGECEFIIWETIAGKQISVANILKLSLDKRSLLVKGFVSKKTGKTFDAFLVLDQDYKIQFDFPKTNNKTH